MNESNQISNKKSESNDPEFSNGQKKSSHVVSLLLLLVASCILLAFFVLYLGHIKRSDSGGLVEKGPIKASMALAIKNGANLDVLKHVYSRRQADNPFLLLPKNKGKYYPYETAFSLILEDLRADYFSTAQFVRDSVYIWQLDAIIQENSNRNPFDQLEGTQRYYFNNVLVKSAGNYSIIQEDVNYIAKELQEKNLLVSRYLSKSSISFVISIIALVLTFFGSIWQINLAYKSLRIKDCDVILKEEKEEKEEKL